MPRRADIMEAQCLALTSASQETFTHRQGTQLESVQVKPAALLLTPAPLECLRDELKRVTGLVPDFHAISLGICWDLKTDRHADNLRAALKSFCLLMIFVSEEMYSALDLAYNFYVHSRDESRGSETNPGPITQARVARLLEPDFQAKRLEWAREAASHAAKASKAIREHALPLLQQLEQELDVYVADYVSRDALLNKRKKSLIPLVMQDALWGTIEPTPWTAAEVQALPGRLSPSSHFLHQLSAFFDTLELYYRRLSEVDTQQILEYGYTTPKDLTRLFQDRILCQHVVQSMVRSWTHPGLSFVYGAFYDTC